MGRRISLIHKEVTAACGRALLLTSIRLSDMTTQELSANAALARSLGGVPGRRHLVDAILSCLCRGYA